MKFKHFTMKELDKMSEDQKRGYLLAEMLIGYGHALMKGIQSKDIEETMDDQVRMVLYIRDANRRAADLWEETITMNKEKLERMLEKAVGAPDKFGYN